VAAVHGVQQQQGKERAHMLTLEIGDREERIKEVVLNALQVGKQAAVNAAANTLELNEKDARVAERVVRTIWKAVEEGELTDYVWDVLYAMKKRGEY
jgi:hypothetical protein